MARPRFTKEEGGLIATAAAIVFTRVFAFSLTTLGFTEYARGLMPGTAAGKAGLLAGVALGAYGVTMALAQLGNGILSDRVGRRRILLSGTVLFVVGAAICAVADSIGLLIAGRLVMGLGGVSSAAMAAVGETVPEERRTTAMAMIGIPAGLGVFLGFIIGPLLTGAGLSFASLFGITAALGLLASVRVMLRPLPPPHPALARADDRRNLSGAVLALALAGFCINFAMNAVMFDFDSGVLDRIGNTTLAVDLVVAFVAMGGLSRVVDRKGAAWQAILVSLVLLAAAAPLFRLSHAFWLAATAGAGFFAAHALLSAVLPSQVSKLAGRSGGKGHGIQLVVAYLGSAAGGLVAGAVAGQLRHAFEVLAVIVSVALILVVVALRPAQVPAAALPQD